MLYKSRLLRIFFVDLVLLLLWSTATMETFSYPFLITAGSYLVKSLYSFVLQIQLINALGNTFPKYETMTLYYAKINTEVLQPHQTFI